MHPQFRTQCPMDLILEVTTDTQMVMEDRPSSPQTEQIATQMVMEHRPAHQQTEILVTRMAMEFRLSLQETEDQMKVRQQLAVGLKIMSIQFISIINR